MPPKNRSQSKEKNAEDKKLKQEKEKSEEIQKSKDDKGRVTKQAPEPSPKGRTGKPKKQATADEKKLPDAEAEKGDQPKQPEIKVPEQVQEKIVKKLKLNDKGSKDLVEMPKKDKILTREFYMIGVVELAQALLGKIIVRKLPDGEVRAMIVEAEAYKAPEDKACHAYNNKKTDRTKFFWQDGGHVYVYSIYGNNYCLNITAKTKDDPEAVLIRAVQPLTGIDLVKSMRQTKSTKLQDLSNGPGKVGGCLAIDKNHNGVDLTNGGDFYLIDNPATYEIEASKRINIDYAEEWKDMMWRFTIKGNSYVSKGK